MTDIKKYQHFFLFHQPYRCLYIGLVRIGYILPAPNQTAIYVTQYICSRVHFLCLKFVVSQENELHPKS